MEEKRRVLKKKSLLLLERFFALMRILLIRLDIFTERVYRYREEKSPFELRNRHIVEQMHCEGKKDKTDSF